MNEIQIDGAILRPTAKTHALAEEILREMHYSRLKAELFGFEVVEDARTRRILSMFKRSVRIKQLERILGDVKADLDILVREKKVTVSGRKVVKKCVNSKRSNWRFQTLIDRFWF